MEEKVTMQVFDEEGLREVRVTRGDLLKKGAAGALGLGLLGGLTAQEASAATGGLDRITWISPRGTLNVMDDYNLVVPIRQGYFRTLGLDVRLIAGPIEGTATTRFVAQRQADVGFPSPGILTFSIDSGVPVFSIWEMFPGQVFGWAFPSDSNINNVRQLAGKTIAVGSAAWSAVADPMLDEIGVDPKSVRYVDFGPQWAQAAALGQADAALVWWGLRGQLIGQSAGFGTGISLKFIMGQQWGSKHPSNVYAVRKADLTNAQRRAIYTRFLRGVVQGFEFGKANPRAAAQITYGAYPELQSLISPQVALNSMVELASGYGARKRRGFGWGSHDVNSWAGYLNTIFRLGQTKRQLRVRDVVTNQYVAAANNYPAGIARARSDARRYRLNQYFRGASLPAGLPL
jgi:NitT/TauT family transport system substrate-binding protein